MRTGDFESAWAFSDEQLKARNGQPTWHLPRHFQSIWDGSSLDGKRVLVRCYHGLGDTIQFIRYIPLLKQTAAEVIVWAQAPLLDLLKTAEGIDQLLPLHEGSPDAVYDADIEIMELAHYFRTTVNTIPGKIPYLHVAPKPLAHNGLLNVGLVWKAGGWDQKRDIPFSTLEYLFETTGVNFFFLQANPGEAGWHEGMGINPGPFDMYDYVQVVRGLDLLITIDSMPAHLAGALGVPVWTLLHSQPDWRWMEQRGDSPWYPTMRLFRQQQAGEWEPVVEEVYMALNLMVR